ncbi:unnamed protein product [Rotaria magnacalcarata]|nr:unnamed protein product [Rotaria magnacalcarata]CAF4021163.1 unnamed protein product [Rotaria magnacalcarata]CAF4451386.1 unnamed protein product [Rotaria magnacalcarata]CAF5005627.1 unnamed protein product [Rotaria magnacalcarata]
MRKNTVFFNACLTGFRAVGFMNERREDTALTISPIDTKASANVDQYNEIKVLDDLLQHADLSVFNECSDDCENLITCGIMELDEYNDQDCDDCLPKESLTKITEAMDIIRNFIH